MYNDPDPLPENYIKNGDLFLKLYYGKNKAKVVNDDEYYKLVEIQTKFLKELNEKLQIDIKDKLGLDSTINLEKRL